LHLASTILVQHVSQDVLGVLKTLHHLEVGGVHRATQRVGSAFTALVHVGDDLCLAREHDLRVVLEVDLHDLVRQTEHDGVPRAHPLLHVDDVGDLTLGCLHVLDGLLVGLGLLAALEVTSEVLEEGDLLLERRREVLDVVLLANVLAIGLPSLNVVKVVAVRVEHDLGGIVEEHANRSVRQVVAQAVL